MAGNKRDSPLVRRHLAGLEKNTHGMQNGGEVNPEQLKVRNPTVIFSDYL